MIDSRKAKSGSLGQSWVLKGLESPRDFTEVWGVEFAPVPNLTLQKEGAHPG